MSGPARVVDRAWQLAEHGVAVAAVRHPLDDGPGWTPGCELVIPADAVDERGILALTPSEAHALAVLLAGAATVAEQTGQGRRL